jgi:glutamate 5-kinase
MSRPRLGTVVVKVGTSVITNPDGTLNVFRVNQIVDQIARNRDKAKAFVVVTSGAIASGITRLGLGLTPQELSLTMKQVCASIGQPWLMGIYDRRFKKYGMTTAQILITEEDLANRYSYQNFWRTLKTLLQNGAVPIVNENDAISVRELIPVNPYLPERVRFGDNDRLSALIASRIKASMLIILTNVDGFYIKDSRGRQVLVKEIRKIDRDLMKYASGPDRLGRGGMVTKLEAAKIAAKSGVLTIITNGANKKAISGALNGRPSGTLVFPSRD